MPKRDIQPLRIAVFKSVLEEDGKLLKKWSKTVDLRKDIDDSIDHMREGCIKARKVVLERKRLKNILERFFAKKKEDKKIHSFLTKKFNPEKFTRTEGMENYLSVSNDAEQSALEEFELALNLYLGENAKRLIGKSKLSFDDKIKLLEKADTSIEKLYAVRKRTILAHRIAGFGENRSIKDASKKSFKEAFITHVAEIEFDIRTTKDKVPIVHHNATLGNSAGRTEHLRKLTSKELCKISLNNKDVLMTLEDVFKMAKKTKNETTKMRIEIKDFDPKMIDAIIKMVKKHDMEHRVSIQSWFFQILQYMYEKSPDMQFNLCYSAIIRYASDVIYKFMHTWRSYVSRSKTIFDKARSKIRKKRLKKFRKSTKVQYEVGEFIKSGLFITPSIHWTKLINSKSKGEKFIGIHAVSFGGDTLYEKNTRTVARVLKYGSINVMAVEKIFFSWMEKVPFLLKIVKAIAAVFRRLTRFDQFVQECHQQGIKVDLFGLNDIKDMRYYFKRFEKNGIQLGTICSGNEKIVSVLSLG